MMVKRDQFEREVILRLAKGDVEGSARYSYRSHAEFQADRAQRFDARYVLPLLGARDAGDEPGAGDGLMPIAAFQAWVERASVTVSDRRNVAGHRLLTAITKAMAVAALVRDAFAPTQVYDTKPDLGRNPGFSRERLLARPGAYRRKSVTSRV